MSAEKHLFGDQGDLAGVVAWALQSRGVQARELEGDVASFAEVTALFNLPIWLALPEEVAKDEKRVVENYLFNFRRSVGGTPWRFMRTMSAYLVLRVKAKRVDDIVLVRVSEFDGRWVADHQMVRSEELVASLDLLKLSGHLRVLEAPRGPAPGILLPAGDLGEHKVISFTEASLLPIGKASLEKRKRVTLEKFVLQTHR